MLNMYMGKPKQQVTCDYCKNIFFKFYKEIIKGISKGFKHNFCSNNCYRMFNNPALEVICKQCNKQFLKHLNQIKKHPNNFCSQSCAATYNNTHKTKGIRISKLETWLQTKLTERYPNLEIHYNRKDAINSELDIYIPSLKLAFELNGIFHYEPIYGQEKLDQIQNNDHRKFAACAEAGISLCIIDTSKQKYFKEQSSEEYLNIIVLIINKTIQ